jgi:hypothetical protein
MILSPNHSEQWNTEQSATKAFVAKTKKINSERGHGLIMQFISLVD